jgi:hypothetical protein
MNIPINTNHSDVEPIEAMFLQGVLISDTQPLPVGVGRVQEYANPVEVGT